MLIVAVGMRAEARLLPADMLSIVSGGDPGRLEALLRQAPPGITAVLSFGIAGGLDPALRPGALVVAQSVGSEDTDPEWADALLAATGARLGPIAAAAEVVGGPAAKAALRHATGALSVDLESGVAVAFAKARGLPFAALRAVADPAAEALPTAAAVGLTPAGDPAPWRVLGALLRQPGELPALLRIAARTRTALAALAAAVRAAGPALAPPGSHS